ncbi:MAG TPA: hypothetical protein H9804_01065 [Candidatus Mucispirillum faecigallinarum]|uniref:Peptidase M30 n=1 Tax=Candidatus Mucispirillum faecigallinarum TaxID=2838699 RepID=A0A9D2GTN4_9BACT|nr:hypothetical protein [Candidatus Mucispirillum faecigallinarum]
MSKIYIFLFLLIIAGCAADVESNKNENVNYTTLLASENALTEGSNTLNYDTNKTLHTLIYYAQSPVNENFNLTNSYSISDTRESSQQTIPYKNNTVLSKANIMQQNSKDILNNINNSIAEYAYNNKIETIKKNSLSLSKTAPSVVTIGTKWENINILDVYSKTFTVINATCVAESEYAYFFLQDGLDNLTVEQIEEIKAAFDKDYLLIHQYYGEEEDTDGNGKVSFVITNLQAQLFGFFYLADKYSEQDVINKFSSSERTNESDVLYINYNFFINGKWDIYKTDILATFIHEFQHMVMFDVRNRLGLNPIVNSWITEGLSMLAEYYGGYTAPHHIYLAYYFQSNQGISLISNSTIDYGLEYLFARYLQIRFGDGFIKKIYTSQYNGIKAVEEATGMNFNELFLDFTKMILLTGRGVTNDTRYNIEEFNYPEGSEGFNRNGFNLASVIDEAYSYAAMNNSFITSSGYNNKTLSMYGFAITKWNGVFNELTLAGNKEGIAGIYYAW